MIRVWSDGKHAGVLDRLGPRGSTFAYDPAAVSDRAVSELMPVRVQSWDSKHSLLPIFEMNLPEGSLRERLTRRFAKATGSFDDIDLLGIVGRSQIGRLRYSGLDQKISDLTPLQSIDEILRARRDGGLFNYLLERFAEHSGISGVQPKVMIRATDSKLSDGKIRQSPSIQSATHIVKMWDHDEYPELAANEYFCLSVARELEMNVPSFAISDDGGALIIDRFDLTGDQYLGFEDFCVLNALGTTDKYKGGYETRIFKRVRDFITENQMEALEELFRLFVLNCAIRNGDAHLKNFGITYEQIGGPINLAPVYDIVTTSAYVPNDPMALTLDGSTNWPDQKGLLRLAQSRADITPKKAMAIFEATADAMSSIAPKIRQYFSSQENEVGTRILAAWETGIRDSLGLTRGLTITKGSSIKRQPRVARSDGLLLEYLRQHDGSISGTLKSIAEILGMPQSTLAGSVSRLVDRDFVQRTTRKITLLPREV